MIDKFILPRDIKGIRLDVRGDRDLVFNNWHRGNLGRNCYVTDVDFLEYRFIDGELILKCIFEVKEWHVINPKYVEDCANFKAIKKLAKNAGVPFYFVWYEKKGDGIKLFKLWDTDKSKDNAVEMNPDDFKKFVEEL
jgi:hypothetical protein